jgi:hypothetical protein
VTCFIRVDFVNKFCDLKFLCASWAARSRVVKGGMSREGEHENDLKSYQARQGLVYVQEKPKFIQDFMQRAGMNPSGRTNTRHTGDQEPDYDDEMPMMVDSEGNQLSDFPAPTPTKPAGSQLVMEENSRGDLEFLEASLKEFEHEALDPSEVPQQPSQKRGKTFAPSLQVRSSPKVAINNSRLLSFSLDDEEEES